MGRVDVAVAPYVDADMPHAVEDVAGLRLRERDLLSLRVLGLGVARYRDAGLLVAILGEPATVQADARGRPAPHVGDTELAVGGGDDRICQDRPGPEVLQAHAVETVEVVGLHGGFQALDVARARRPSRVLEPLGHLVRVVVRNRLAYERV